MLQFSLRNLLIAVAFCAFGAAGLVNANAWWLAISWSAALFSLLAAGLLTWHRQGPKRAYWGGYLLFGTLYLLLLMYSIQPVSSSNSSVLCLAPLSYHNLLTSKLTTWTYSLLPASLTTEFFPSTVPGTGPAPPGSSMPMSGYGGGPPGSFGPFSGSGMMPGMPGMMGGSTVGVYNPRFVNQTTYVEVGHALWIVVIAAIGGLISSWLSRTRERPAPSP